MAFFCGHYLFEVAMNVAKVSGCTWGFIFIVIAIVHTIPNVRAGRLQIFIYFEQQLTHICEMYKQMNLLKLMQWKKNVPIIYQI